MALNLRKLGSLVRLIRRAFGNYGRSFAIMTALGFIGGLFEGFGIAAVVPLFYVVTGQTAGEISSVTDIIFKTLQFFRVPLEVVPLLGVIVVLFIAKGTILFIVRYYNAKVVARFEESYRKVAFRRTLATDWSFLMRQKSGHLESILLYDTERGTAIMSVLAGMILLGTTFAAYAVIALNISVPITLSVLVLGAIIFYALKPVFYRIRRLIADAALAQKDLAHHVSEHAASIKSIKAMAMERPVVAYANGLFARLRYARVNSAFFRQSSLAAIEPLGFLVIAGLFLLNYRTPGFDIASFAVVMFLVQRMFAYVQSISAQLQSVNEMAPYLRTMMHWRRETKLHAETDAGTKPFVFRNQLLLNNVSFAYRDDRPVLTGLNLAISHGSITAVVGPSGVGKTTVVDLLLRLFAPQSGSITVDETDAREIRLSDWRRHFGYVPQDAVLLDTTIRENIRFYSSRISEEDISAAAKQANIFETIMGLSEKFDSQVGGRGVNLSGGQRQRILLARALARKPSVLILDEATSAVDNESEIAIREALVALRGKVTVIIIAHRPTSIMDADAVDVLDEGRVVESGSPQALVSHPDSYLARILAMH